MKLFKMFYNWRELGSDSSLYPQSKKKGIDDPKLCQIHEALNLPLTLSRHTQKASSVL